MMYMNQTNYRILIYQKLEGCLKSLMGRGIDDYEIISVTAQKKPDATVIVYNHFSVLPENCLESIQVKIAVEVGI